MQSASAAGLSVVVAVSSLMMSTKQTASFRVFVGLCFLLSVTLPTTEAAPASIIKRDKGEGTLRPKEEDTYKLLRNANMKFDHQERLIEELQINAHCPFKEITYGGVKRIMCVRPQTDKCNSNTEYYKDICLNCHQAYDYLKNIVPGYKGRGLEKVEVGCIYHPRSIGTSIETQEISHPGNIQ